MRRCWWTLGDNGKMPRTMKDNEEQEKMTKAQQKMTVKAY